MSDPSIIERIDDDEVVYRHIPGDTLFQAPGPRITSNNFRIRAGLNETGVSVSRAKFTTPDELIQRVGGDRAKGSRVAAATVRDVRRLGFDIVAAPLDGDPGHAELRPVTADLTKRPIAQSLAELFQFID